MLAQLGYGICLSSFFSLVGIYIWSKGSVSFLAGYKNLKINNEKLMAKRIGMVMILFGVETMILITINLFVVSIDGLLYGVLAILHILAILILITFTQAR
ncbi:hypothetical protein WMO40_17880 [Bacillaceae bacterium CLA-AA-H227]|uniref:Uncharacterized protein n=1 Tax=Robertmurraya yapensis (ex Hitch et al 2024) TaxID=3133160 RepID=A0ACC6SET0_9BACI